MGSLLSADEHDTQASRAATDRAARTPTDDEVDPSFKVVSGFTAKDADLTFWSLRAHSLVAARGADTAGGEASRSPRLTASRNSPRSDATPRSDAVIHQANVVTLSEDAYDDSNLGKGCGSSPFSFCTQPPAPKSGSMEVVMSNNSAPLSSSSSLASFMWRDMRPGTNIAAMSPDGEAIFVSGQGHNQYLG